MPRKRQSFHAGVLAPRNDSRLGGELLFDSSSQARGFEASGAGSGLVRDFTLLVDEVEAVGPGGVGGFGGVLHVVDDGGELDAEGTNTGGGVIVLHGLGFGGFEEHLFFDVAGDLPLVGGMGLADIDEQEVDSTGVFFRQGVEVPYLGTEGGSSVGAEDKGDGPFSRQLRELDGFGGFGFGEGEVRGGGADLEAAFAASVFLGPFAALGLGEEGEGERKSDD